MHSLRRIGLSLAVWPAVYLVFAFVGWDIAWVQPDLRGDWLIRAFYVLCAGYLSAMAWISGDRYER